MEVNDEPSVSIHFRFLSLLMRLLGPGRRFFPVVCRPLVCHFGTRGCRISDHRKWINPPCIETHSGEKLVSF